MKGEEEPQTNPCAHMPRHDPSSHINCGWISWPLLFQAGRQPPPGTPRPLSPSEQPEHAQQLSPQLYQPMSQSLAEAWGGAGWSESSHLSRRAQRAAPEQPGWDDCCHRMEQTQPTADSVRGEAPQRGQGCTLQHHVMPN